MPQASVTFRIPQDLVSRLDMQNLHYLVRVPYAVFREDNRDASVTLIFVFQARNEHHRKAVAEGLQNSLFAIVPQLQWRD